MVIIDFSPIPPTWLGAFESISTTQLSQWAHYEVCRSEWLLSHRDIGESLWHQMWDDCQKNCWCFLEEIDNRIRKCGNKDKAYRMYEHAVVYDPENPPKQVPLDEDFFAILTAYRKKYEEEVAAKEKAEAEKAEAAIKREIERQRWLEQQEKAKKAEEARRKERKRMAARRRKAREAREEEQSMFLDWYYCRQRGVISPDVTFDQFRNEEW